MTTPRMLLAGPFDLANQVCKYVRDQTLTNNMWEVAYGVCHEALRLDSLEDFNATEADLMDMKNNILATSKSRDRSWTSSLRPMFTSSSAGSKEQGSTLGKTFASARAATSIGALHSPGHSLGKTLLPFFRPLAPPPGIPSPSGLSSYIQDILPTSYAVMGVPMEYNFDPMTGRPLKPLISSMYSLPSQPLGASSSISTGPGVAGLSALPGLGGEECPLVVGSPSRSSQVVVGGRIPTVTISSSTAETTLLASPTMAPRVSTSCANVTGGDVHKVICQCLHSSPNRALAGAGIGERISKEARERKWWQRPGISRYAH